MAKRRGERGGSRRRVSVIGVLGELLITVGVVALLFVAWQLWIGDAIAGAQEHAEAEALAQSWAESSAPPTIDPADPVVIPVMGDASHGDQFGVMYVPRFGSDWKFRMRTSIYCRLQR